MVLCRTFHMLTHISQIHNLCMDDNIILLTRSAVLQQLVQTIWYSHYCAWFFNVWSIYSHLKHHLHCSIILLWNIRSYSLPVTWFCCIIHQILYERGNLSHQVFHIINKKMASVMKDSLIPGQLWFQLVCTCILL